MAAVDYIWEKVHVAVVTLCSGGGSFEERLFDAYVSALMRLNSNDPPAEIAEELNSVLLLCQRYLAPQGGGMNAVDKTDRRRIAEKLVSILMATSWLTGGDGSKQDFITE